MTQYCTIAYFWKQQQMKPLLNFFKVFSWKLDIFTWNFSFLNAVWFSFPWSNFSFRMSVMWLRAHEKIVFPDRELNPSKPGWNIIKLFRLPKNWQTQKNQVRASTSSSVCQHAIHNEIAQQRTKKWNRGKTSWSRYQYHKTSAVVWMLWNKETGRKFLKVLEWTDSKN